MSQCCESSIGTLRNQRSCCSSISTYGNWLDYGPAQRNRKCKERDEMAVKQGLTSLADLTYQQELKAVEDKKADDEQKRKDKSHKRARDQYFAAKKQTSKRPKVWSLESPGGVWSVEL